MAASSCCKCRGGAKAPDKLLQCLRCHRLPHTSCCPEIERCDCSCALLPEARPHEEEVPSWVMDRAQPLISSAIDGAACCKCGGGNDTPDKLVQCFRCYLLYHTSCCLGIAFNCCDACLLEAQYHEEVPSWVTDLAAVDVSAPCRKDRFCPTCLIGFSGRCCPAAHRHADGQGAHSIEIHVLGEGDSSRAFVDVMQINGLYDCSEIQLEMDLAPAPRLLRQLVPLHPAKCRGKYCGSIRIGYERLYCSMKCEASCMSKSAALLISPKHKFVKALLAEDFTSMHHPDAFCMSCCVAFCTTVHSDHANHPSVEIVSYNGWNFISVPNTEMWLGNFAFVPEHRSHYRLIPLTPPTGCSCECFTMLGRYLQYCSLICMVRERSGPGISCTEAISLECTRQVEGPAYLEKLLCQDLWTTCCQDIYCFFCSAAFCNKCCPNHASYHHPEQKLVHLAQVKKFHHYLTIDADDANRIHYCWDGIQRLRDGNRIYIPIRRSEVVQRRTKPLQCTNCNDRMISKCLFCSTKCRIEKVPTGRDRTLAQALVRTEFKMDLLPDSFCISCCQSFSSICCSKHGLHHAGHVIHVVHHDGLVLASVQELLGFPDGALGYIQKVELNGVLMVPIYTSKELFHGRSGSSCSFCLKVIGQEYIYCSVQCEAFGMFYNCKDPT